MGMIDLSLCKVERADSSFAATLFSEPGNGARLQQHVIDKIEPRRCVFRLGNGQQELDQFLRNPPAELRGVLILRLHESGLEEGRWRWKEMVCASVYRDLGNWFGVC